MSACLNSTGKAIVIEFERNGELHQAVRWTTDVEMLERLISMPDYLEELRQRFEATGAVLVNVSSVESQHVSLI